MKDIILALAAAVLFGLLLLVLFGCSGPSRVEKAEVPANFKLIAHHQGFAEFLDVYTVDIDGRGYVIAVAGRGVAICPKTP